MKRAGLLTLSGAVVGSGLAAVALPLLWLWLAVSIVLGDPIMTVNSSSISALV